MVRTTNAVNCIGQKFGKLTVLSYFKNFEKSNKYYFNVRCDCGIEKAVPMQSVLVGNSSSCGCIGRGNFSNAGAYVGQKFGKLTILDYFKHPEKNVIYFKTLCDCGVEKNILKTSILNGKSTSCVCSRSDDGKNHIGETYNNLTVLEICKHEKFRGVYFKVKCICGKERTMRRRDVINGIAKSCGCVREVENPISSDYMTMIGRKFNKLTIVSLVKSNGKGMTRAECMCECGTRTSTDISKVISGNTKSCGCIRYEEVKLTSSFINKIFNQYHRQALNRSYEFNITKEDFVNLINSKCFYCGSEKSNSSIVGRKSFKYNGIDRVDSSKGYNLDNVVPCCKLCNWMKRDLTQQEFYAHIAKIYAHRVDPISATIHPLNPDSLESLILKS